MYSDSGWGFLAWRGTLLGHPNFAFAPDPANIARDNMGFMSTWSPGQYLIPGLVSFLGVPIGVAIVITVAAASITSVFGWLRVVAAIAPQTASSGVVLVLLLETFRYATLPFGIYDGGEILIQAATPWIVLAAFRIPQLDTLNAALLAGGTALLAFLAKLSGLIVAGAAFGAVGMLVLFSTHRINKGLMGGMCGVLIAFATIYVFFISRGWTAADGGGWSLRVNQIATAIVFPWLAGVSWTDFMDWILLNPSHPLVNNSDARVWLVLPFASAASLFILSWHPKTLLVATFRNFAITYYLITTLVFIALFSHNAAISLEERHFRPAGMLFLICGYIYVAVDHPPNWVRYAIVSICCFMSFYGLASFASHLVTSTRGHSLDRPTWTQQTIVDSWPAPGFEDTEFGVFIKPGGGSWRDGSLRGSSSLRRSS